MVETISLEEARRIALAAQGFDRPRPSGRVNAGHLRRTIRQLGLLQLDFVTVVGPAHYQVLFSRLGPYERALLDDLAYRRHEFTEQWAHEASLLPVDAWPLLRHRMAVHRPRPYGFEQILARHPDYMERVLAEVRTRGPLTADALDHPEGTPRRLEHAWFGSVPRATLEALFGRGVLAVAGRRPDFARLYDLAERVVPREQLEALPKPAEARRELLRRAARAHGVGTAADLADYYRMTVREARPFLEELAAAGELRRVRVAGWREPAYLAPDTRVPRRIDAAALLSPFDPLIWFRPRTERLFGFEYRFEIFTPPAKRRWGCYVLPFLQGDRLAARVDLKSDRADRCLRVPAAHLEPGMVPDEVATALAAELRTLAGWLDMGEVLVGRDGNFTRPLADALKGT
jgi:uncharacterized protein YcaQ